MTFTVPPVHVIAAREVVGFFAFVHSLMYVVGVHLTEAGVIRLRESGNPHMKTQDEDGRSHAVQIKCLSCHDLRSVIYQKECRKRYRIEMQKTFNI